MTKEVKGHLRSAARLEISKWMNLGENSVDLYSVSPFKSIFFTVTLSKK